MKLNSGLIYLTSFVSDGISEMSLPSFAGAGDNPTACPISIRRSNKTIIDDLVAKTENIPIIAILVMSMSEKASVGFAKK